MPFVEDIDTPSATAATAAAAAAKAANSNSSSTSRPRTTTTMLWALRLDPDSIVSQIVDSAFTVTMASLCDAIQDSNGVKSNDSNEPCMLLVGETPNNLFSLCTLSSARGKTQQPLNLFFGEGASVVFKLVGGTASVDLTGVYNVISDSDEDSDDDECAHGCSHHHDDDDDSESDSEGDSESDTSSESSKSDGDHSGETNGTVISKEDTSKTQSTTTQIKEGVPVIKGNSLEGTTGDIVIEVGRLNDLPSDTEAQDAVSDEEDDDEVVASDDDDDSEENDFDLMAYSDDDDDDDDDELDANLEMDWDAILAEENEDGEEEIPIGMGSVYASADDYNLDDTDDLDLGTAAFDMDELDGLENDDDTAQKPKTRAPPKGVAPKIMRKPQSSHAAGATPTARRGKGRRVVFDERVKVGVFQKPPKHKARRARR